MTSKNSADDYQQIYNGCTNVVNIAGGLKIFNTNILHQVQAEAVFLQNELKKRFLGRSPLQNVPWLRKEQFFADQFVELQIERQQFRNNYEKISIEDIFKTSDGDPPNVTRDILFEGKLGNGKSTLSWHLAQEWANEKQFMKQFDFVFVIPLRQLKRNTIKGYIRIEYGTDAVVDVLEVIKSKRILLILDGLDEIRSKEKILQDICEIKKELSLTVIVMSRPIEVKQDFQNFKKILVNGFDLNGIDEFLKNYFDEMIGEDETEAIKAKLFENENIQELCHCPLFLMLFCLLLENNPSSYKLPETQTDLFKQSVNFIIELYVLKHSLKVYKKIDLFQTTENKDIQIFVRNCNNFGCLALNSLHKDQMIFTKIEVERAHCDLFMKFGFLLRTDNFDVSENTFQIFHKSFLEFFISFYLKNLYFSNKSKFKMIMEEHLCIPYFPFSMIGPFLFGLMEEKIISFFKDLSMDFYNYRKLLISNVWKEVHKYKDDICFLFDSISNFLSLDVICKDEGIFSKNINTDQSIDSCSLAKNTSFQSNREMLQYYILEIHPALSHYETNISELKAFASKGISVKFINSKRSNIGKTDHVCFNDSQFYHLVKTVFRNKPESVVIHFPNCESCDLKLLRCIISFQSISLISITMLKWHFSDEEIQLAVQLTEILLVEHLHLICNKNESFGSDEEFVVSLDPLIQEVKKVKCKLKEISLVNLKTSQADLDLFIQDIGRSNSVNQLTIKYSISTEYIVDLSKLLINTDKWSNWPSTVKLENVTVVLSEEKQCKLRMLSLYNCQLEITNVQKLLSLCEIRQFHCNYEFMSEWNNLEDMKQLLYKSVDQVIVKGTFSFCPKLYSKFCHPLFSISWDPRYPLIDLKTSEQNFTSFFNEIQLVNFRIELSLESKEYLKQLEVILNCFLNMKDQFLNLRSKQKVSHLLLDFYSERQEYGIIRNQRFLEAEEMDQIVKSLQKFQSVISTGIVGYQEIRFYNFQKFGQLMKLMYKTMEGLKVEDRVTVSTHWSYRNLRINIYPKAK